MRARELHELDVAYLTSPRVLDGHLLGERQLGGAVATSHTLPSGSAKKPLYPPQAVCYGCLVTVAPAALASASTASTRSSERTL